MSGTLRDCIALTALAIAVFGYERRQRSDVRDNGSATPASETHNVILVVSDGLRWQEVFRGADSLLVFGSPTVAGGDAASVRQRFWRPTVAERREALMPFVWGTLVREGQIIGHRDLGSNVNVTNGMNFSYPGYNEMLVGYPDLRINRNDYGPNPNVTVFEWLNQSGDFRGRVGAIGAWSAFADIFNRRRSGIHVHASREEPLDAGSHAVAMRFLKERRPCALFIAYVETDDWAHRGRYDLTLKAAHAVDAYLAELWSAAQAHPQYRGRTTLIFTSDHGRGRTPRDWTDHGRDVPGADEIWLAIIGPGAATRGEARNTGTIAQAQIAATVAAVLGLDYRRDIPAAAEPIRAVMRRSAALSGASQQ
jgi:hypothetical protein